MSLNLIRQYLCRKLFSSYRLRKQNMGFLFISGWSTIAPPMLAFLYCFAQIGLERTSHPPWVTLTLCSSDNPRHRTTSTGCWLQRLVFTRHSDPQHTWLAATEPVQTWLKCSWAFRTAQNLPVSWNFKRKFWKCKVAQAVIKCCKFRAVSNSSLEACFLPSKLTQCYSKDPGSVLFIRLW